MNIVDIIFNYLKDHLPEIYKSHILKVYDKTGGGIIKICNDVWLNNLPLPHNLYGRKKAICVLKIEKHIIIIYHDNIFNEGGCYGDSSNIIAYLMLIWQTLMQFHIVCILGH